MNIKLPDPVLKMYRENNKGRTKKLNEISNSYVPVPEFIKVNAQTVLRGYKIGDVK